MTDLSTAPVFLALAQPGPGAPSLWLQLAPFALMLGIFYVLVLLPMRRRQKKVEAFQAAIKVGDKVVTTSGIHGSVAKLHDETVSLQVADKVRIEIARAAIGGFQGQEPVVQESGKL